MRILEAQIVDAQAEMMSVRKREPVVEEKRRVRRTERVAWPEGKLNLSIGALRGGASPGIGRVRRVRAFMRPTIIMS